MHDHDGRAWRTVCVGCNEAIRHLIDTHCRTRVSLLLRLMCLRCVPDGWLVHNVQSALESAPDSAKLAMSIGTKRRCAGVANIRYSTECCGLTSNNRKIQRTLSVTAAKPRRALDKRAKRLSSRAPWEW